MKIHLIRSEEISNDRFRMIFGIVNQSKGPMEFIVRIEDISEGPDDMPAEGAGAELLITGHEASLVKQPWSTFFERCEQFRAADGNIKDEDYVVFFTDYGNEKNWFSSWDPSGRMNFFIQTSGWEDFVESEECYPVVYELVTIPLYLSVSNSPDDLNALAHYDAPRGCPFDYCRDKTQVRLRLRTGDVCPECRDKMAGNLDPAVARQVFSILDSIRSQMLFRNRFALTQQLSRIEVSAFNREIRFTDIGRQAIKLSPREITVYMFFLGHPEGVGFPYVPDYIDEITALYRNFSDDANLPRFNNTVSAIVNNEEDTLSQLINKIKKKITRIVDGEIACHYIVKRDEPRERHLITLDRDLVSYPDPATYHENR